MRGVKKTVWIRDTHHLGRWGKTGASNHYWTYPIAIRPALWTTRNRNLFLKLKIINLTNALRSQSDTLCETTKLFRGLYVCWHFDSYVSEPLRIRGTSPFFPVFRGRPPYRGACCEGVPVILIASQPPCTSRLTEASSDRSDSNSSMICLVPVMGIRLNLWLCFVKPNIRFVSVVIIYEGHTQHYQTHTRITPPSITTHPSWCKTTLCQFDSGY